MMASNGAYYHPSEPPCNSQGLDPLNIQTLTTRLPLMRPFLTMSELLYPSLTTHTLRRATAFRGAMLTITKGGRMKAATEDSCRLWEECDVTYVYVPDTLFFFSAPPFAPRVLVTLAYHSTPPYWPLRPGFMIRSVLLTIPSSRDFC